MLWGIVVAGLIILTCVSLDDAWRGFDDDDDDDKVENKNTENKNTEKKDK